MKKFLPTTLVVASCALGLGLAAGSLAIASYAPDAAIDEESAGFPHDATIADIPMPVVGDELFFAQNTGTACMDRGQVIRVFQEDQADFGGQTVEIVEGRDQAFADAWRDQTGLSRVTVSGILGHMFYDEATSEWTVDLVEFDESGCAMSRTLLPGHAWTDVLESSVGA